MKKLPEKAVNSLPNLIREVGARGASIPGFLSLAIGNPAAAAIPVETIREAAREVIEGDPMLTQLVVYNSLKKLDMQSYISGICELYKEKCDALLAGLKSTCAEDVKILEPEGGMFVWMELPESIRATA